MEKVYREVRNEAERSAHPLQTTMAMGGKIVNLITIYLLFNNPISHIC